MIQRAVSLYFYSVCLKTWYITHSLFLVTVNRDVLPTNVFAKMQGSLVYQHVSVAQSRNRARIRYNYTYNQLVIIFYTTRSHCPMMIVKMLHLGGPGSLHVMMFDVSTTNPRSEIQVNIYIL